MSKEEYLKYAVKLLMCLSNNDFTFSANLMCAEADKDYDLICQYLTELKDKTQILIDKLSE